ncbi:hypothetical protein SUGI_0490200 [Cryptomeria japonica]|nr:hypothetical protein SUGI_0490200 [Cryptomeria japonica]
MVKAVAMLFILITEISTMMPIIVSSRNLFPSIPNVPIAKGSPVIPKAPIGSDTTSSPSAASTASPPQGSTGEKPCPEGFPKLVSCISLLGTNLRFGGGNVTKECCPVIEGVLSTGTALCFCKILKAKLLGMDLVIPVALQLFDTCGLNPPEGFTCPDV